MDAFPRLETDNFTAWFADNSALGIHAAGYNGVASLVPTHSGNNLFVPTYSGLNYEHISMAGLDPYRHPSGSRFEPRCEPMMLTYADAERVELTQPSTAHAQLNTRIRFTVEQPYYLHQRIEMTPNHRHCGDNVPNRLLTLWASYMHGPPDRHLYLKTDLTSPDLADWVAITAETHGAPTYHVYHMPADRTLDAAEHLEFIAASLAPHDQWPSRSDQPLAFYYGLCHDDQMFLMMFRQSERVRLAYSPHGGGQHPTWNPAWDYVLIVDDASVGITYAWDICLVVKPFNGRADVLEEVRRYMDG